MAFLAESAVARSVTARQRLRNIVQFFTDHGDTIKRNIMHELESLLYDLEKTVGGYEELSSTRSADGSY